MAENKTLIGEFPKNITGTKQYGNNLKAFAAALSAVGMVGIDRIHELLTGVFDISVSSYPQLQCTVSGQSGIILYFAQISPDWAGRLNSYPVS